MQSAGEYAIAAARNELIDLVTADPNVISCIDRISNSILLNDIIVTEKGKKLNPKLNHAINKNYKTFFRNAIPVSYMCGFVPYYISKQNGIKMPKCLPIGTFTWSIERKSKDKKVRGQLESWYNVRAKVENLKDADIFIFETHSPISYGFNNSQQLFSPLNGVLSEYIKWKDTQLQFENSNSWNMQKHVAVTERIDLKDQTTSGIQLLDEQRRYNLTGTHNNIIHNSLLRLKGAGHTQNVGDAFNYHVRSEFQNKGHEEGFSNNASVHIMPPNTDLIELNPMDSGIQVDEKRKNFKDAVHTFFGLPDLSMSQTSQATTKEATDMHREQYANLLNMQQKLQYLGEEAYSNCFDVNLYEVQVCLRPLPRFEIMNVTDIKTLFDTGIFTPADMSHLRRQILNL